MSPAIIVPVAAFIMSIILAIGIPIAKAYARRMDADSRNPRIPDEVAQRLERMERAIEAVAIEVERISEGQRFTTKLLSEGANRGEARQVGAAKPVQDRVT